MAFSRVDSIYKTQKAFIENKGQFDGRDQLFNSKILFGISDEAEILFTKKGLTYRFDRIEKEEENIFYSEAAEENRKIKTSIIHIEWLNANKELDVIAEDEYSNYWNLLNTIDNSAINYIKVKGYKKIIFKNLYPNIDLEYIFHPRTGLKYSFILHPGADASQIKMKYSGTSNIDFINGKILLRQKYITLTDYAPVSFYELNKQKINSTFYLNNNIVSFRLDTYDKNKTVIIDPWTVTGFTNGGNQLAAHEITADAANNAFLLLKRNGNVTGYVQKYNAAGTLLWTTIPAGWFDSGDIQADPAGNVYISNGTGSQPSRTVKLNAAGAVVWTNSPSANFDEISRIAFNCDYTKMAIAGAARPCCGVGAVSDNDPTTGAESNFAKPAQVGDIVSLCFAPNGYLYGIGCESNGQLIPFPTEIICLNPATNYSTVFNIPANFVRKELIPSQNYGPAVINGIAADCNYLYTYNGDTLKKRNLLTGAIISFVVIPGGTDVGNSGLALDKCGNIYAGSSNGVYVYDTAFSLLNTFVTSAEVSDIVIGKNGIFYACGGGTNITNSFITQFTNQVICPSAITTTTTSTPCGGQTGTATATAKFCSGPYTYTWLTNPVQNTQTITGLAAGTYTVVVTGSGNCSITDTAIAVVSAVGGNVTVTTSSTPSLCTSNNGTALATVTSGTPNFSYAWSPSGGNGATATGLAPGTYTVIVTDGVGCTGSDTVTVIQSSGTLTATTTSTPSICTSNNGTATVTASGGTPNYTYSWAPSGGSAATANNLAPGTYTVQVSDVNGCTYTVTSIVAQSSGTLTATVTGTPSVCTSNNGTATVAASGGTPNYTYSWAPSGGSAATANNLAPGTYTVQVNDASGCSYTATVSVGQSSGTLTATISSTAALCTSNNGTATVTASGGTPNYTYAWSPSGGNASGATGLAAGSYTVIVSDASGCIYSTSTTVGVNSGNVTATTTSTAALCGLNNGTATAIATGGNPAYTYNWMPTGGNAATANNLSSGTYTVIITDVNGCTQTSSVTVNNIPGPIAGVNTGVTIALGDSTNLTATGGGTYTWIPNINLSCTNCSNPIAFPSQTTTYCVEVTDNNGCKDTACVIISVEIPCPSLQDLSVVPNAFSPNGDGVNDEFCLQGWDLCIEEFLIVIYNRWGQKVYESTESDFCWNGLFNGKMPDGQVFVYCLSATFSNSSEKIIHSGNISLIK